MRWTPLPQNIVINCNPLSGPPPPISDYVILEWPLTAIAIGVFKNSDSDSDWHYSEGKIENEEKKLLKGAIKSLGPLWLHVFFSLSFVP